MIWTKGYARPTTPGGWRLLFSALGVVTGFLTIVGIIAWGGPANQYVPVIGLATVCSAVVTLVTSISMAKADRDNWRTVVRIGGYTYQVHRSDPNYRRAFATVSDTPASTLPVNRKWIDYGGKFRATDLVFEVMQ